MNDERPIEKLLRRFAKKRREDAGAPLEMHPASRRLLQGEVARQFRKAGDEKASATGWLAALRRRWIYATAAVSAVVIAGALLVMNNNQPDVQELAKQEVAPAKSLTQKQVGELAKNYDAPAPVLAPAPESGVGGEKPGNAPALAVAGKQKDTDEWKAAPAPAIAAASERSETVADRGAATVTKVPERSAGETHFAGKSVEQTSTLATGNDKLEEAAGSRRLTTAPATPAPVSVAAPANRPAAPVAARARQATAGAYAESSGRRDSAVASAASATPPPAGAPAVAFESRAFAPIARGGGLEREKQAVLSQSFANLSPNPKSEKKLKAAPTLPVLLNFQIEQAGNQLRVIDGDGSTYLGEVAVTSAAINGDTKKGAEALKDDGRLALAPPAQTYAANNFYRVTGTNRTLNQQVVFTWNFIELTNTPAQTQAVSGLLKNQTVNTTQQIPALFNNSGISGRAQIDAAKEIEINAVPVNQ